MTSFLTGEGLWLVHHVIFRRLASADTMVMRLNILLLVLVTCSNPTSPTSTSRQ